jgi:hypothetical protein
MRRASRKGAAPQEVDRRTFDAWNGMERANA